MKKQLIALTAAAALSAGIASQASASNTVTVEKGDTLWGISQANGVTVNQLKDWNNLSSNLIFPNQQLNVSSAQAEQPAQPAQPAPTTYTVKSGDTLFAIAKEFNVSLSSLLSWNAISSHWIYPGDELVVNSTQGSAAVDAGVSAKANASVKGVSSSTPATPAPQETVVNEFVVEATAYTAYCTGCSGITYTGIDLRSNPNQKVIAVDPNVIPLGSKVWVEGYGTAIAGDIGGAIKGNRIDVFIPSQSAALAWGRKDVTIKVLD